MIKKKAVAYFRVSTDMQAEDLSLETKKKVEKYLLNRIML